MFERFTDRARKVMALANQEAQRFNHEYIGTEHMVLGLVKEGSGVGATVLKNLGLDLKKVRKAVEQVVKAGPDMVTMGKLPQTPLAKKAIEGAIAEARNLGHNYVGTEHILLGLLSVPNSPAAMVLIELGVTLEETREEVLNLLEASRDPGVAEHSEYGNLKETRRVLAGCPLCEGVAKGDSHPSFIAELGATVALLGDNQGSRGWSVLVMKDHVEHVAELEPYQQMAMWNDVSRIAKAIRFAFPESGKDYRPPRINYECLGNLVPHVHWHIIPRHADDPYPTKAVWVWPEEEMRGAMSEGERVALIEKIRDALWDVNP